MEEFEGRLPKYTTRFEQKAKGEITWAIGVHLDDKEQTKIDTEELIEWVLKTATKIKQPEMEEK